MTKSISKNITLIVKIDFWGRGRGLVFERMQTKSFYSVTCNSSTFYNVYLKKKQTIPIFMGMISNRLFYSEMFFNANPKYHLYRENWELLGKEILEEYSSYLSWTWSKSKWENNNGFLIYWCHNPFAIGSRISKCSKFRPRLAGKLNKLGTTKCFYQW